MQSVNKEKGIDKTSMEFALGDFWKMLKGIHPTETQGITNNVKSDFYAMTEKFLKDRGIFVAKPESEVDQEELKTNSIRFDAEVDMEVIALMIKDISEADLKEGLDNGTYMIDLDHNNEETQKIIESDSMEAVAVIIEKQARHGEYKEFSCSSN